MVSFLAHQAWSANIMTTVSDMFPKSSIGAVIGIGGMFGGLGNIMVPKMTPIKAEMKKRE